ncbi:hypothetical protein BKA80DRAFT_343526 [Phyllosticta citrichinensis]
MAVEQAQGKVEASVFAIVTAFTSGLDVCRKLRDRRGKRKKSRKTDSSKAHPTPVLDCLDDELQLGKSLQRGPVEIQDRYQLNRSHAGERFAQGDAIAHASLTEVLLKLNTGLVAIISTFLCHGKDESNLDYKSLARLSDCSRSEAIDALDQLYRRLSQSQVNLDNRGPYCSSCQSPKHADCGSVVDLQSTRGQKPVEKKPSLLSVKQAPNGAAPPPPTKAPKTKGSQSRLVMVRPRKSRLKPSSTSPRSLSPDATTTAGAQRPPPPPKLHKLPKKKVFRSMTSLAAEPIPEHALPSSPPLPWSLMPPPYPGSFANHAHNRSNSALRRSHSYIHGPRNAAGGPPPKPPKIPLTPQQREQRTHEPTSNLLPYSPYPATLQTPVQPTSQRSHSRLRPQRHSSMPPIPLAERPAASSPPPKSQPTPPPPPPPAHSQSQPAPAQNHYYYHHQLTTTTNTTNTAAVAFPPPPPQTLKASAHPTPPPPPRRRSTVPVPASIYSFTSDSTKLGEIPMARWADGPWDAERAARLNAEAGWGEGSKGGAAEGKGAGAGAGDVEVRKKRGGMFGALWRWGSSGSGNGSGSEKDKEKDRGRRGVKA